jgi:hypothetical protein
VISILKRAAAAFRRWREDRATLIAIERLDEWSRRDLADLIRHRQDALEADEFESKNRSVRQERLAHIAVEGRKAHA